MPKLIKKYGYKIWNYKIEKDEIPKSVYYVGRPSTFGNPFPITKTQTRAQSLKKYEEYLKKNTAITKLAKRHLKGKDLGCWCQPKPCHAEILMRVANEL